MAVTVRLVIVGITSTDHVIRRSCPASRHVPSNSQTPLDFHHCTKTTKHITTDRREKSSSLEHPLRQQKPGPHTDITTHGTYNCKSDN